MTRIDLAATASEATRRRNPSIFGERPSNFAPARKNSLTRDFARIEPKTSNGAKFDGANAVSGGGATKQKAMNKTEARAAQWLRLNGFACLIAQPTRLFPLAGGGTYTPDFLAWEPSGAGVWVIEVKGGYRGPGWDQGYDRYKRAALQYSPPGSPWRFALLTWHARRREWTFEAWI